MLAFVAIEMKSEETGTTPQEQRWRNEPMAFHVLCCLCLCPYKGTNAVVTFSVYFVLNLGFCLSKSKLGHLSAN